jgi:hypothetical protein
VELRRQEEARGEGRPMEFREEDCG